MMPDATTVVSVDWGVIVTALAPSLLFFITGVFGWFNYRRTREEDQAERIRIAKLAAEDAAEIKKIGADTHILVNDQLTREKASRLLDARTNRAVLAKLLGDKPSESERALLASLDSQIEGLAAEVRQRDIAAGTLAIRRTDQEKKQ